MLDIVQPEYNYSYVYYEDPITDEDVDVLISMKFVYLIEIDGFINEKN